MNVFPRISDLLGMLDGLPTPRSLAASLAPLANYLPHGPTPNDLDDMTARAIVKAAASDLTRLYMPPVYDGVPAVEFVAALVLYTMQYPFPIYTMVSKPLNASGTRASRDFAVFRPYLKMLVIAIDLVPRTCPYWSKGPHAVYRGVTYAHIPRLLEKFNNHVTEFALGSLQTFVAPTSTSTKDSIAAGFSGGMAYTFLGVEGVSLMDLSEYDEDEILPPFPSVFVVEAALKPAQNVLVIVLRAVPTSMRYLSSAAVPSPAAPTPNVGALRQALRDKSHRDYDVIGMSSITRRIMPDNPFDDAFVPLCVEEPGCPPISLDGMWDGGATTVWLEGSAGSGKSTLVKRIARDQGCTGWSITRPVAMLPPCETRGRAQVMRLPTDHDGGHHESTPGNVLRPTRGYLPTICRARTGNPLDS